MLRGGDHQDQVSLQLLLDYIEFNMAPAQAVTAPRFATAHHTGSFSQSPPQLGSLTIYEGTDRGTIDELKKLGHQLKYVERVASPVMLQVDQASGKLQVAGDPRAGRHAAVLEP